MHIDFQITRTYLPGARSRQRYPLICDLRVSVQAARKDVCAVQQHWGDHRILDSCVGEVWTMPRIWTWTGGGTSVDALRTMQGVHIFIV